MSLVVMHEHIVNKGAIFCQTHIFATQCVRRLSVLGGEKLDNNTNKCFSYAAVAICYTTSKGVSYRSHSADWTVE